MINILPHDTPLATLRASHFAFVHHAISSCVSSNSQVFQTLLVRVYSYWFCWFHNVFDIP